MAPVRPPCTRGAKSIWWAGSPRRSGLMRPGTRRQPMRQPSVCQARRGSRCDAGWGLQCVDVIASDESIAVVWRGAVCGTVPYGVRRHSTMRGVCGAAWWELARRPRDPTCESCEKVGRAIAQPSPACAHAKHGFMMKSHLQHEHEFIHFMMKPAQHETILDFEFTPTLRSS